MSDDRCYKKNCGVGEKWLLGSAVLYRADCKDVFLDDIDAKI